MNNEVQNGRTVSDVRVEHSSSTGDRYGDGYNDATHLIHLEANIAQFIPLSQVLTLEKPAQLGDNATEMIESIDVTQRLERDPHQNTVQFLTSALEENPNILGDLQGTKALLKKGLSVLAQFYLQHKGSLEVADSLSLPLSTVEDLKRHLVRQIWDLSSPDLNKTFPWQLIDAECQLQDVDNDERLHHDDENDYSVILQVEDAIRTGRTNELFDKKLIEKISLGGYKDFNFGKDALFIPLEKVVQKAGLSHTKPDVTKYYAFLEDFGLPVGEIPVSKQNGVRGMKTSTHIFLFTIHMDEAIRLLRRQNELLKDDATLPFEDTLRFLQEAINDGISEDMERNMTFTPAVLRRGIRILEEYFVLGRNAGDIATDFGISPVTVNQLKKKLIKEIWRNSTPAIQKSYPIERLQVSRHSIERDMNISRGKGGRAPRMAELAQQGLSAQQICQELGITTNTLNKYRHILRRWGVTLPQASSRNEVRRNILDTIKSGEIDDEKAGELLSSVTGSIYISNCKGENRLFMPLKEVAIKAGFRYAGNLAPEFYGALEKVMPVGKATREPKSENQKPLSYLFVLDIHSNRAVEALQKAPELLKYRK